VSKLQCLGNETDITECFIETLAFGSQGYAPGVHCFGKFIHHLEHGTPSPVFTNDQIQIRKDD